MSLSQAINSFFDTEYEAAETDEKRYDVEKSRSVVLAYSLWHRNDKYRVRAIEVPFTLPIHHPITGQPTGEHYCGIIDEIIETADGLWLGDHKTKSREPNQIYWSDIKTHPQITQYLLAGKQSGLDIKGFLWDVIVKPTIKPIELKPRSIKQLENGSYLGFPYPDGYQGELKETPKMYGLRVLNWYNSKPERRFFRRTVERSPEQLTEYLHELHFRATEARKLSEGKLPAIRDTNSCVRYNSLCDYHHICSGADLEKSEYCKRPPHTGETTRKVAGGMSNTRLNTLNRCWREYTYRYIDRIEPKQKTYREALEVGDLVHRGLELFLKEKLVDPITLPNEEIA